MSKPINEMTLQQLKVAQLKITNRYLRLKLKKAKEGCSNNQIEINNLMGYVAYKDQKINELEQQNNRLKALENQEKDIQDLTKFAVQALKLVPFETLLPTSEAQQRFKEFQMEGNHIGCIKLIRNEKNPELSNIWLKIAKDLYETKYRRWDLFPMTGQQPQ